MSGIAFVGLVCLGLIAFAIVSSYYVSKAEIKRNQARTEREARLAAFR